MVQPNWSSSLWSYVEAIGIYERRRVQKVQTNESCSRHIIDTFFLPIRNWVGQFVWTGLATSTFNVGSGSNDGHSFNVLIAFACATKWRTQQAIATRSFVEWEREKDARTRDDRSNEHIVEWTHTSSTSLMDGHLELNTRVLLLLLLLPSFHWWYANGCPLSNHTSFQWLIELGRTKLIEGAT